MAQHSKRYRALQSKVKTAGPVPLPEAVRLLKNVQHDEVQSDGRGLHPPGDRPQADRSKRARIGGPAARDR